MELLNYVKLENGVINKGYLVKDTSGVGFEIMANLHLYRGIKKYSLDGIIVTSNGIYASSDEDSNRFKIDLKSVYYLTEIFKSYNEGYSPVGIVFSDNKNGFFKIEVDLVNTSTSKVKKSLAFLDINGLRVIKDTLDISMRNDNVCETISNLTINIIRSLESVGLPFDLAEFVLGGNGLVNGGYSNTSYVNTGISLMTKSNGFENYEGKYAFCIVY